MNEIIAALEMILDEAPDTQISALDKALRTYGTKYHGSRRRMKGAAAQIMDALEQECGYRTHCRDCDGTGKELTSIGSPSNRDCPTCSGEGRIEL